MVWGSVSFAQKSPSEEQSYITLQYTLDCVLFKKQVESVLLLLPESLFYISIFTLLKHVWTYSSSASNFPWGLFSTLFVVFLSHMREEQTDPVTLQKNKPEVTFNKQTWQHWPKLLLRKYWVKHFSSKQTKKDILKKKHYVTASKSCT